MITKKDPAVLFYTKDWLEGTAAMFSEEKGVYIDLLCYQHQKGFLPKNKRRLAKITGISEEKFTEIWQEISHKFVAIASLDTSLNEPLKEWKKQRCSEGHAECLVNFRMLCETVTRKKMTTQKTVQAYVTNWLRYDSVGKKIKKDAKKMLLVKIDYSNLIAQNSGKKEIYNYLNTLAQQIAEQSHVYIEDANGDGDVNANTINLFNSHEDANENAKKGSLTENSVDAKFREELSQFFSMTTKRHLEILETHLRQFEEKGKLQEFRDQTRAYMHYKKQSSERRHLWQGYLEHWQNTDWSHKLKSLQEPELPKKRKFSINR